MSASGPSDPLVLFYFHFSIRCPGSSVVFDCIDFGSLRTFFTFIALNSMFEVF